VPTRSTPFIILVVAIIPFTRLVAGTSMGTAAAIVPLTIAATPFIARIIETAIRKVDQGLIEAARAMGATPAQIVWKVLIPEALPAITLPVVSLLGYSAMVGLWVVGGWAISASATAISASCQMSWRSWSSCSLSSCRGPRRLAIDCRGASTSAFALTNQSNSQETIMSRFSFKSRFAVALLVAGVVISPLVVLA
jgi:Binding-protein-dependent transport system inner membrane component